MKLKLEWDGNALAYCIVVRYLFTFLGDVMVILAISDHMSWFPFSSAINWGKWCSFPIWGDIEVIESCPCCYSPAEMDLYHWTTENENRWWVLNPHINTMQQNMVQYWKFCVQGRISVLILQDVNFSKLSCVSQDSLLLKYIII